MRLDHLLLKVKGKNGGSGQLPSVRKQAFRVSPARYSFLPFCREAGVGLIFDITREGKRSKIWKPEGFR